MAGQANIRKRVNTWIDEPVKARQHKGFKVPDLVDEAIAHFTKDNKFMVQCAKTYLREMLLAEVHMQIVRTRNLARIGTQVVAKATIEKRLKQAERWRDVMELVPGKGYVLLIDMTRIDLRSAVHNRHNRVRTELATIATLQTLAAGLSNDKQTVGERYSAGQIAAVYQKNQVDVYERMASEEGEPLEEAQ